MMGRLSLSGRGPKRYKCSKCGRNKSRMKGAICEWCLRK